MNKYRKIIARAVPELKIDSLEYLGEGDSCRAFLVNDAKVFRFAKHDEGRESLRREYLLLPRIADRLTLAVPRPADAFFDGAAEDSFIAYPFLPFPALAQDEYLKLGEKARSRCAGQVAEFLRELHAVDLQTARDGGVSPFDFREKFAEILSELRNKLFARLEPADFEFAESELENYLQNSGENSFEPVLLHGDLSPDHVLYENREVTAIIDFGDLMIGDPAWDFLWIYEDYGADFFVRAMAVYKPEHEKEFVRRIERFSRLAAIEWLLDCQAESDEAFSEAVRHFQTRRASARI